MSLKNFSIAGVVSAAVTAMGCGCSGNAASPALPGTAPLTSGSSQSVSTTIAPSATLDSTARRGVATGYVFFRPQGAWARAVPAHPPIAPQSQSWLDHIFSSGYDMGRLQFEQNSNGGNGDGNTPVYYATSSDPTYTLHCTMYSNCPEEGQHVHIPTGARPSDGGDHHMAVVNFSANREDDFWLATKPSGNGGTLDIGYGGHGALDGDGTNFKATASGVALTAGLLRESDLMAGFIPHALYITSSCTSNKYVYPAVASDDNNPNCPPQGTRLYLDLTAQQIGALAVPQWTKTYLMAWHTFGGIISDHGGNNFSLMPEHDYTSSLFGGGSPWLDFAKFVQNDPASKNVWAWPYNNVYHINFPSGNIDLRSHLKVLMPCVNTGAC